MRNAGKRRTVRTFLDCQFDSASFAFKNSLNPPVGEISHPTSQAESFSNILREVAVGNALNSSVDEEMGTCDHSIL